MGTTGVKRNAGRGAGKSSHAFHSRSQYKTPYSSVRKGITGSGRLWCSSSTHTKTGTVSAGVW
jgi:hypothetical protein